MSQSLYIAQGEEAASVDPDVVIRTILGSCISICLWDDRAGVGGMNHLLVPSLKAERNPLNTLGAVAMDRLINQMMALGAQRSRLRAKLFGGSSKLRGHADIGAQNAEFGQTYLTNEAIPCDAISVGGNNARKLLFYPTTGVAKLKFVNEAPALMHEAQTRESDVELF